jgi:CHAT domain-containing protein
MFNEANALFRVEINRTPLGDRAPVFEEFLSQIAAIPASLDRYYMESSVRIQWSTSYIQIGDVAHAVEEMVGAETAFGRWCEENNILDTWNVPQFHALVSAKLSLIGDDIAKLRLAEEIIEVLVKNIESSKMGEILSTASESASALFQATGENRYLEKFFALHERLEKYDEDVSEDFCDLVIHRNYLISLTSTNLVDRQKSLEWIEGFLERYPHFQSPAELESLHRRRSILLRGLQRIEASEEAEAKANEFKELGPSLGNWLHMKLATTPDSHSAASKSTRYDDEDEEGEVFFQAWTAVAGDQEKIVSTAIGMLRRWASEDLSTGLITSHMYHNLMGDTGQCDHTGSESMLCAQVQHEEDESSELLQVLIPPDQTMSDNYNPRWCLLVDWLSNPPKGQRMKRLFCLFMLREARQYNYSDKHLWKLRIQELEQILDFHSRLPPSLHEVTRSQRSAWLAALASTYMAQLEGAPDLSDPSVYTLLLAADEYCDMAIKELRSHHQPGPFLMQQRLGAQICLLKISRLEERVKNGLEKTYTSNPGGLQGSEVTSDDIDSIESLEREMQALRTLGLQKVQESERISTASELEASWANGLDGVRERQRVLEFQASFWTVHNAIHLLLKEQKLTDATITAIWSWVQKYKARSLARTIGSRSDIPPGMLSQILASPAARCLYNEMLVLNKKIDAAPSNARFELRRQLDKTRLQMKEDPILRRLIDLREGSPLDVSDIEAMVRHAGRSLVLVDWFYLPPYPDNGLGRLLLFTLKAGSSPTMDILTTNIEDVHAWQEEFLDPQKLCLQGTRREFNKTLAGLVAPLRNRSKANEVLVFCPSTTLHRLPLHALHLQDPLVETSDDYGQPLIHRNPVIYIHSLSLLRSSFSAAEHAQHLPRKINPQFLSGISEADATAIVDGRQTNYTAGRNSIKELARMCDTIPRIDKSASKEVFMEAVTQSRLLHLHTHCNWQYSDPLDHHVEFPNVKGPQRSEHDPDLKLTAKEIFATRLVPGTHVNLIACQGGLLQVKMGDEVMGLVPAFLYSGATSTISTLWSIADRDGARFSKHLFESIFDQCEEQTELQSDFLGEAAKAPSDRLYTKDVCLIDLAMAIQEAVIEMDPNWHEPLYHWAGFVLHGYWMFSVLPMDAKQLGRTGPTPQPVFEES